MQWQNELTHLLQVTYPIIQAPMLGVTTPHMVATVSNAGALGSLPIGGLAPDKARELIQAVKKLTSQPFTVNLFAHEIPAEIDWLAAQRMQAFLRQIGGKYGFTWPEQPLEELRFYSAQQQIDVVLAEQVPVISFTFGMLDAESLAALKKAGTVLIGTATCLEEALLLQERQVAAITLQGMEAGGHRGTFSSTHYLPQKEMAELVRETVPQVQLPVVAAGGIMDGNVICSALSLGAQAVQLGSAFLRCPESAATPAYKRAVAASTAASTALTQAFSGRWARGIQNSFMQEIASAGIAVCPYPVQDSLTRPLREQARQADEPALILLWAGQAAYLAQEVPAAQVIARLVEETEQAYQAITE